MSLVLIVLPNQLFADHPGLSFAPNKVVIFEDPLFFGDLQYPMQMHRQKLWLHRASMTRFQRRLEDQGHDVLRVSYRSQSKTCQALFRSLVADGVTKVIMADPVDFICERRLRHAAGETGITLEFLASPGFLNTSQDNQNWAEGRKRWFMAEYYKSQRRRLSVLMNGNEPAGGQWSFDEENRKKVPKSLLSVLPWIDWPRSDEIDLAAKAEVLEEFPNAIGRLDELYYPTSHEAAADWLQQFLERRFELFGDFEDAIVEGESWLWHAVLAPALNIGLLTPKQVLNATLAHAQRKNVPLNSVEGFVRQIIGWREFIRATYEDLGVPMRTTNHWNHQRPMPTSFYNGTTGIGPVDDTIQRVLKTGYCHHIERLMVLGGFMFLCEINPDDVYRWFMEMFVDSYDWVMVPNVYAMSQHADGGLITTKPYFSGSNYVRKMSHWSKGEWSEIWDGLYWRFIIKHSDQLAINPRWSMMCRTANRLQPETRTRHLEAAESFLRSLN